MPDTVLIGRLSQYGKILSFRCDRLAADLKNGIWTAGLCLVHPIPASLTICGALVKIYYESQPKSCRCYGITWRTGAGSQGPLIVTPLAIMLMNVQKIYCAMRVLFKTTSLHPALLSCLVQMWKQEIFLASGHSQMLSKRSLNSLIYSPNNRNNKILCAVQSPRKLKTRRKLSRRRGRTR